MELLPGGGVRWTPTADHVGEWTLTVVATDDDHSRVGNGETTLVIVLTVRENQAPAAPRIVSPDRGEDVTVARPALVVQNPVDPEGDPLQILYEIDTSDTFRSPVSSGPVPAGSDGTTSWTVPQDLADGARYYWRVWATDGLAEGSRVSSYFFVTLEGGDGGPDGGLDGGGDTGPIGPVVDPGCSCRAGASAGGGAGLVLLLLLAVVGRGLIRR